MADNYDRMRHGLRMLRSHFSALSGETVGPPHATWQQVAADCAATLRHLASLLDDAREGKAGAFPVFPSLEED